jgi:amino-acid N-acetyltransferase
MNESSVMGRRHAPVFSEKTFYLEEFYGKSLLFGLIPPSGERLSELDSLVRTLRELRRNQTRCVVIGSMRALPPLIRRLGRLAPRDQPCFNPTSGLRRRPYPPDSAITAIWRALRAGSIVAAGVEAEDPGDLVVFIQELASRLRVFKLLLLDRAAGLVDSSGNRHSFVQVGRRRRILKNVRSPLRRAVVRAACRAIADGVASVNLTSPREIYEELFSFSGTGTVFTESGYGHVRQISLDDFEEVEALIQRGQSEGFLLSRSDEEITRLLPSCFGYRIGDERLAGIVSLLTEPYRRERAGEITALYTLTRYQGEGVAAELMTEVLREARARRLRYVFACTSEERAAHLFEQLKFRRISPKEVSAAKWQGYNPDRIAKLSIFRCDFG